MRWLYLLLLFPVIASAGEDCSMLSGTCREVCGAHEEAEKGAFFDCTDRQECCVKKAAVNNADEQIPPNTKVPEQGPKTER